MKSGEQLTGFVKDEPMYKMNYRILYKESAETKSFKVLDTSVVLALRLSNNERYDLLHFKADQAKDSTAVLAKLLVEGKLRLYEIANKDKQFFLLKNQDNVYTLEDDDLLHISALDVKEHHFKQRMDSAMQLNPAYFEDINKSEFNQAAITKLVIKYNQDVGSVAQVLKIKNEFANFLILGFGGRFKNSVEHEFYLNAMIRAYFPRISKGTSLNLGLQYFHESNNELQYTGSPYYSYVNYTGNMIAVPAYVQQNFIHKNIRPYIFAGFSIDYYKRLYEDGYSSGLPAFPHIVGISVLYGAGIEVSFYKGFMAKAEYRYEAYSHHIISGFGYVLKHK